MIKFPSFFSIGLGSSISAFYIDKTLATNKEVALQTSTARRYVNLTGFPNYVPANFPNGIELIVVGIRNPNFSPTP